MRIAPRVETLVEIFSREPETGFDYGKYYCAMIELAKQLEHENAALYRVISHLGRYYMMDAEVNKALEIELSKLPQQH